MRVPSLPHRDFFMVGPDPRRCILAHLERVPGLHPRALHRALDIPLGTLLYHLELMESAGSLVVRTDARRKRYFPAGFGDDVDRLLLSWLRQPTPCRVILHLLELPGGETFRVLSMRLPVAASTLSWHLHNLVAAGVLEERPEGRGKRFFLVAPARVRSLAHAYADSLPAPACAAVEAAGAARAHA